MALTISPASPVATTTADELLGHKEQLQAAFARTSAKAFPTAARDAVVTLADTTRLGDACATLAANHVSAIPVHRHDQPHNFVGVFDLLTLLNEEPEDLYVDLHSFTLGDLNGDSYSLLSDLVTVEEDAHLMSVLALHGDIAISTVFVRAADGHLVNGITRSDIVNALLYAVGPIRELLFQPISGLGLSLHFKTDTVAGTATLWSALQAMREKRQTAVAVVDPDGQLMGVISLLDVMYVSFASGVKGGRVINDNRRLFGGTWLRWHTIFCCL
ncbi:uncharacterized protein MONBRDRAFT_23664 [Monosiga brevicollis MX1]|uniref:CBS domain-containing protein n=1 Tax=Monosiga brevicollis TaxID=81824 RepID=A9UU39_MONBE|nr:uncharacterized protein MONBRDRAFT_23664 [Monosiga brevicollis MX1]EDQ91355.1 predicted protein [Monosiga brevicollis MX1]|eukprot:XP_001743777.1 hypothetical protein [Monosiga brevicollis MX1]